MDIKTLKLLNKNFNKNWEKLSQSEKDECVRFMLEVLKESDKFYKSSLVSLRQVKDELYGLMDDSARENANMTKQVANFMMRSKIEKEDKLQCKILSSDNRQLLFSDIYTTYTLSAKARESVEKILQQAQDIVLEGARTLSSSKLVSLYVQVELLSESHERYQNVFSNQAKKVKELFPQSTKTNDDELTM